MDKTLEIAHCVQEYAPNVGGMAEVVRQLSERLVRLGHRVTVFTSENSKRTDTVLNGVSIRAYALSGNAVEGINGDPSQYISDIQSMKFDVVTIFASQHWASDLLLPILDRIDAKKVFVPTGFSALHNQRYNNYFNSMSTWLLSFDMNVFLSNSYQDILFAKNSGVTKFTIIPNGAAEEEFSRSVSFDLRRKLKIKNEKIILHVGSYTGIKGHVEALNIFLNSRERNTVLLMIGARNSYLKKAMWRSPGLLPLAIKLFLKRKKYFLVEWSRNETIDAFRQADLFLFPSKVECSPIVLFESMAAGLPFLSSPAGNTEELVQWSNGAGIILPSVMSDQHLVEVDVEQSAIVLDKTICDTAWLKEASMHGHEAWQKKFTWQNIALQYERLYKSLVNNH